ncbi:MAG: VPLPA-CTERM sorting domain-containing protein [Paracoccaceae bacterium]|nr:VPLPA-CTERM sorting domain-containing protein [Paracoccaceae bacterium]
MKPDFEITVSFDVNESSIDAYEYWWDGVNYDGEPPYYVYYDRLSYVENGFVFSSDDIDFLDVKGSVVSFFTPQTNFYEEGLFVFDFETMMGKLDVRTRGCCGEIYYRFNGETGSYDFADEDQPFSYIESANLIDVRVVVSQVPLPASFPLFLAGIAGLGMIGRRRLTGG